MQKMATFHAWLEKLNPFFGIVLLLSMGVKSSYGLTFGLLDYTKLPGVWPNALTIATGIGIAASVESLSVSSGSICWQAVQNIWNMALDGKFNKRQLAAIQQKLKWRAWLHGSFAAIAVCSSTYLLLYFTVQHVVKGAHETGVGAVVTAIILQAVVFYLGVFFEPSRADPLAELTGQAYKAVGHMTKAWGDQIASGQYDNKAVRAMQRLMPADLRGTFDPLITADGNAELWDSTKVTQFLLSGLSLAEQAERFDNTQRTVNGRLAKAKDDPTYGIVAKDATTNGYKGRGLLIPWDKMCLLFAEEIQRVAKGGKPFTQSRKRPSRKAALPQTQNGQGAETEQNDPAAGSDDGLVQAVLLAE